MAIDCYAHCGREKYLPLEALLAVMGAAGVERAVLCQHLGQFDNSYLASIVASHPCFSGIALVDHRSGAWRDAVAQVANCGFRGLRITGSALVENDALGLHVASLRLIPVIYAESGLETLIDPIYALALAHPTTPIVISHLGNPVVANDRLVGGSEILVLASLPNVHVALSGLHMFCAFPYAPLKSLVRSVFDAFGATRVLWGSNFPVCGEDAADYGRELALVRKRCWGLDGAAVETVTDTNARSLWFA